MNKKNQIEVIIHLSDSRDADLIEVHKRIGDKAFKEIAKICLLSLIEPTFYDERRIKKCLSESNPHKAQKGSVKIRLTFYEDWKKDGVLQIKKELRENVTLSLLTKALIRQRIASELIPICFKKSKNIILLDKEFIPILKSAKIGASLKVPVPVTVQVPVTANTIKSKETEEITTNATLKETPDSPIIKTTPDKTSDSPLPFEENPTVNEETKKEEISAPEKVEDLPIEETPTLQSFNDTDDDELSEDELLANMLGMM